VTKREQILDSEEDAKPAAKPAAGRKRTTSKKTDLMETSSEEEDGEALQPRQKKSRGSRKRKTGAPPTTARQQMDQQVRGKLRGTKQMMETTQKMSLPISRQDGFKKTGQNNIAKAKTEASFPWVIHGLTCFTEQASNDDGHNKDGGLFLAKPKLKLFVGSKAAKKKLLASLKSGDFATEIYSNYDDYEASFRSESALKKPGPKIKIEKINDDVGYWV
jgi:hypothetical protein